MNVEQNGCVASPCVTLFCFRPADLRKNHTHFQRCWKNTEKHTLTNIRTKVQKSDSTRHSRLIRGYKDDGAEVNQPRTVSIRGAATEMFAFRCHVLLDAHMEDGGGGDDI